MGVPRTKACAEPIVVLAAVRKAPAQCVLDSDASLLLTAVRLEFRTRI